MAAGADGIDDLHILRHGAMRAVFTGIRAPSTLGTFLRAFTHGHALQLHAVHRRFLGQLAAHAPLLPGSGEKAFIDVDSTHKRVYGRVKQGAEYGRFRGIRTLHPLLATICTPHSRPVIATVRMRRGKAADSRGAPRFVNEALATAVEAGCAAPPPADARRGSVRRTWGTGRPSRLLPFPLPVPRRCLGVRRSAWARIDRDVHSTPDAGMCCPWDAPAMPPSPDRGWNTPGHLPERRPDHQVIAL
jgi:hypothetical protein